MATDGGKKKADSRRVPRDNRGVTAPLSTRDVVDIRPQRACPCVVYVAKHYGCCETSMRVAGPTVRISILTWPLAAGSHRTLTLWAPGLTWVAA